MVPFNDAIFALGNIEEIRLSLKSANILSINTVPLDVSFSDVNAGVLQNLVTSAFLKSVALKRNKELRTDTRRFIWKKSRFAQKTSGAEKQVDIIFTRLWKFVSQIDSIKMLL